MVLISIGVVIYNVRTTLTILIREILINIVLNNLDKIVLTMLN